MSDEGESKGGWIESIVEGGLPQLIAGPAGKAISRLIGAGVEIPAAWLEQKAQGIRDHTEAKSAVMKGLTEKAVELGVQDPNLLGRGLNSLLGKAYREQKNREAVAFKVVEHLEEEPAPADSAGPSDDWLNVFEEHAARASSEKLRDMWARVLAGEIRKPSSISLATLRFFAELDQSSADAAEFALSFAVNSNMLVKNDQEGEGFLLFSAARSAGLFYQSDPDMTMKVTTAELGKFYVDLNEELLEVRAKPKSDIAIHGCSLTRVGREMCQILRHRQNEAVRDLVVKQLVEHPDVTSVLATRIIRRGSNREMTVEDEPVMRWERASESSG